jgi:hypothetical protein
VATNIKHRRTALGFDPAAFRTRVAVITSKRVLLSTAAMVKPPIRSMIVGENIWEKIYLERQDWTGLRQVFTMHLPRSIGGTQSNVLAIA